MSDRVHLAFTTSGPEPLLHTSLSAVRQDGPCLWVAGDETTTIERLTARSDAAGRVTGYGDHLSVPLADLVELPAGADGEADIEGLARGDGWLWAVGSHSLKRRRVDENHSPDKARKRLATVVRDPNRFVLVRIPLVAGDDGLPEPRREAVTDGQERTAAVLGGHGDDLAELLADDPHLAPFLPLPGKDNGLDIEGITAHADRLYIGLRGPVLRGWAALIEVRPRTHPDHPHRLRLGPLDGDGARYRTHFLNLGGLGVRDLCPHGDDVLILAGPSMDLDGPVRVLRWQRGAAVGVPAIVHAGQLQVLADLHYGQGEDHAEGIAVLEEPGRAGTRLLVVYDSPAAGRRTADGVLADVIDLPDR